MGTSENRTAEIRRSQRPGVTYFFKTMTNSYLQVSQNPERNKHEFDTLL
jgi:hypothetical protein